MPAEATRFSTKYTDDESDLLYYGYRYYNPSTGAWLSRDPIQESGGDNLYVLLLGDPLDCMDILGLFKSEYHRSITEAALNNSGLGTKCISQIADANAAQDDGWATNSDPFADSVNHGDNNQLGPTIDRIRERMDELARPKTSAL